VVVAAMRQFVPLPAGAEAPDVLPVPERSVTAQASGLGGVDTVTLSTTPTSGGGSTGAIVELASFTTTATASPADAASALATERSRSVDGCAGPVRAAVVPGTSGATTCPTVDGDALTWHMAGWTVQVVDLAGSHSPTALAAAVAAVLRHDGLPSTTTPGFVSVVTPSNPSVGTATTADLAWRVGASLHEVRSQDDPDAAIAVAAAMVPYPSG
jgi:hypothetical protein